MTGRVGTRRRMSKRNGVKWCALTAGILLLASISILYAILSSSSSSDYNNHHNNNNNDDDDDDDPLLRDSDPLLSSSDDRIDLLDDLLLSDDSPDEEELLRSLDSEGEPDDTHPSSSSSSSSSGFFFDHLSHVIRHSFEIDRWDEYANPFQPGIPAHQPPATLASDDVPVDEEVRMKMLQVGGIEDALLLKQGARVSPLRQGWGSWFDAKTDFLRKDKMFRSNFELLNPFNHLLLQDPDAIGLTPLTRGDKILHKAFLSQINKSKQNTTFNHTALGRAVLILQEPKIDQYNNSFTKTIQHSQPSIAKTDYPLTSGAAHRWASFPGLPPYLSFSNFMDSFFRHSKCSFRVFMVWNSPSWMFTIRHQRGLESLLYHHPDACVVIFSETVDLDFFKDFVKHRYAHFPHCFLINKCRPRVLFAAFKANEC